MEVIEKEFYHLHHQNQYDEMWEPGKCIDNQEAFVNERTEKITSSGLENRINELLLLGNEMYTLQEKISTLEKEERDHYIEGFHYLKEMIIHAQTIKLEQDLESLRLLFFPSKVSRKSAIWLCKENQLAYWVKSFSSIQNLELVTVIATGNLTRASAKYLTLGATSEDLLSYWESEEKEKEQIDDEYMFQGKLYIRKKKKLWK